MPQFRFLYFLQLHVAFDHFFLLKIDCHPLKFGYFQRLDPCLCGIMEVLKFIKQEIGYQQGKLIEFSNCKRANKTTKATGQMN